jgi:ketosteroid isomerase-like protein
MKLMRLFSLLLILIGSNLAFGQVLKGPASDTKVILKNIQQFSEFVMHQQPDKIALAYTENAKIFPMGTEIIAGRTAIQDYWTPKGSNKTIYHKIIPVEIEVIGDTAYDYGRYEGKTLRGDGSESTWKGKYVIVWKKVNNQWLIELDCWNPINP